MTPLLVLVILAGMMYYWLRGSRVRLTRRFGREHVYLHRGPGMAGLVVAAIAILYLSAHVAAVLSVLLLVGFALGVGALATVLVRRQRQRGR